MMNFLGKVAFYSPRPLQLGIARLFGTQIVGMPGWVHIGEKTVINLNAFG